MRNFRFYWLDGENTPQLATGMDRRQLTVSPVGTHLPEKTPRWFSVNALMPGIGDRRKIHFYKNEYRGKVRWWIDITPWVFPKRLLIMYPSAEEWLEKIGSGKDELRIATSTEYFPDAEALYREKFEGLVSGTSYVARTYKNVEVNHRVLLCPVTLYVFGRYPKVIWYRVL